MRLVGPEGMLQGVGLVGTFLEAGLADIQGVELADIQGVELADIQGEEFVDIQVVEIAGTPLAGTSVH